jgi:hypothetical protein
LFQEIRGKDIEDSKLETKSDRKFEGKIETVGDYRFQTFFQCFCRMQNVFYTKIGIDELDRLYTRQQQLLKEYLSLSADSASNKLPDAKRLMMIGLIMIFIVHAAITDESLRDRNKELIHIFE